MRDEPRVKEKIALTLDSRQLVSIVLGSAVLLGIVFYLGVTVGKDLGGPQVIAAGDPLERLDQQAALAGEKLTFPEELIREEPPTEEEKAQLAAAAEAKRSEAAAREASAAKAAEAQREAEVAAAAKAAEEAARADAASATDASAKPVAASKPAVPRDLSAALAGAGAQGAPGGVPPPPPPPAPTGAPSLDVSAALAKVDARNAVKPPPVPPSDKVHAGGFTVQVAASPSQREADALVAKLREKGVNATVTVAEIAGRGTFYRVRVGRFSTREEAVRYLEDLRRETRLEGFVASLEN